MLVPPRGVDKGWEPYNGRKPRGPAPARLRTIRKIKREALCSPIVSAICAPSGDRPSPHNTLGRNAYRAENKLRGMRGRSSRQQTQ
ncbi:hypothetical protein NDU88_001583 [Pleurodeles waltl]|uniref:Uncharacterized protein n=1 Tax=Pleurodeles waltl TaxID=8319 RepID=A0AAV7Q982_PLEWA|nr:hypothetical protein NDU88_001583 [Pleurodeles waltl]